MSTKWRTAAPIDYPRREEIPNLPFYFRKDFSLKQVPDWLKEKRITEDLSSQQREKIEHAQYAFVIEHQTSIFDKQDRNTPEELFDCNLAIWLAKPSSFGFEIMVSDEQIDDTWNYRRNLYVFPDLRPLQEYIGNIIKMEDLELAHSLFQAIIKLKRKGSIWIAIRTLWRALVISPNEWEIRYLLLWIIMEALFGPAGGGKIRHRISQRVASFLSNEERLPRDLNDSVKEGYNWRCKIVHGMSGMHKLYEKEEKARELIYELETFVRDALVRILSDDELIHHFEEDRESYLNSLRKMTKV